MQPISSVRLYFKTFFIVGFVSMIVLSYAHEFVDHYISRVLVMADIVKWYRDIILSASAGGLATYVLHRWAWRWRWFRQFPDIEGRWEGWSFSADKPQWRASVIEITQNGLGISAITYSATLDDRSVLRNESEGYLSGILPSQSEGGTHRIVNFYVTKSRDNREKSLDAEHTGIHILDLFGDATGSGEIIGKYLNTRDITLKTSKGSGIVRWRFAGRRRRKKLNWHKEWAMAEPTDDPRGESSDSEKTPVGTPA